MVGSIVESVARTPVNLEVTISELDGNVMVWMPPPPSNNLWVSFLEPPKLKLHARPLNMHSLVQYTAAVRTHGTPPSPLTSAALSPKHDHHCARFDMHTVQCV